MQKEIKQTTKVTLQSTDCERDMRMANLAEQAKEWAARSKSTNMTASSVQFCFATSAENPLTMDELSCFMREYRDFLEGYNVEWSSEVVADLGDKVLVTISYN